jgi:predicted RecB family nuclease
MCSCPVCAGPLGDELRRRADNGKDLTLIWNLSRARAEALEALGVGTYNDLLDCDQVELLAGLRERKVSVSATMLQGWCQHANSYGRAEAVLFGPCALPASFIALDLEYGPHIWLTGAYLVDGERRDFTQLWADTPAEERRNLRDLARLVAENPSLPVITYNGTGADLPELRKAGARLKLTKLVESIVANHLDLYQVARAAVRLPVPTLSLSEVATYFGVTKLSGVGDGYDAVTRYLLYADAPAGPGRDALREELLEYNRDDLVGLAAVAEGFRRLSSSAPAA